MKIFTMIVGMLLMIDAYAFDPTTKPITVVVPYSPGGTTDMIFREMEKYAATKNINLNPLYKPGASGVIGLQELNSRPGDGYSIGVTLLDSVASYTIIIGQDIDPNNILMIHQNIFGIVVKNDGKFSSWTDVITRLKNDKKGVSFGYSTPIQEVIYTNIMKQAGIADNYILANYSRSGVTIITDIIGETLDTGIGSLITYHQHIQTGKLKLIAVDASLPLAMYPNVPTLKSLYPNLSLPKRGSSIVLPNGITPEAAKFWKQFMSDYTSSPVFLEKSKTEFYEVNKSSVAELKRNVNIQVELLKQLKK
jgi:tripartite-type tricarboxylate transporter receptor subunit TctC